MKLNVLGLHDLASWEQANVKLGHPETAVDEVLKPVISNAALFAADLYEAGLASKVTQYLKMMLTGSGAVRRTLEELV